MLEAVTHEGETLARQTLAVPPPYPYDGTLDLLKGAVNRLHTYSPQFRQRLAECGGVRIATWTEVSRQSPRPSPYISPSPPYWVLYHTF